MNPPDPYQAMKDESHLRLIVICHYVMGALELLGGLALVGFTILMARVIREIPAVATPSAVPVTPGTTPPPPAATGVPTSPEGIEAMTNLVVLMYGGMALAVIVLAVLTLLSAWAINARKWHTFSLVMAGLQCLSFPFGTALGIFTFIVLLRPSVLFLYERKHAPAA